MYLTNFKMGRGWAFDVAVIMPLGMTHESLDSRPGFALDFNFLLMYTVGGSRWFMTWVPAIHVGDLHGVPGSQIQLDPALAVMDIWRVSQQVGDLSLSSSLPLK